MTAGAHTEYSNPRRASAWSNMATAALFAAVFFMFAFPKGGIKILEVPITFGYLLCVPLLAIAGFRTRSLALPVDRLAMLGCCLMLSLWGAFVVQLNGTTSFGYTLAFFTATLILPLFALVFFSALMLDEHERLIQNALLWAVRFLVVYGIFLFFFKMFTGQWIEIPYITVNVDDLGQLDDKFINRGGIFKLISTYNNGNIFGVSMCIIGPLYLALERRAVLRYLFYAALVLTLSRTVWIGLIAIIIMRVLSARLQVTTLLSLVIALVSAGVAIYWALLLLGTDLSFVFDRRLGGRVGQLSAFGEGELIPNQVVEILPEIVYTGVVASYGYFGLVLFVAHLLAPVIILMLKGVSLLSPTRAAACAQGLLLYSVLAFSDAAFSYIPVMLIFWSVAGLGLWFARYDIGLARPARREAMPTRRQFARAGLR